MNEGFAADSSGPKPPGSDEVLSSVLARWLDNPTASGLRITPIRGGLSGAGVWRVELAAKSFCLRRWPSPGPSESELAAIHGLIAHLAAGGLELVPVPLRNREGRTIHADRGTLWELTAWLSGEPIYLHSPTPQKRKSAMVTLAHFHRVAKTHPLPAGILGTGRSPGLVQRLRILCELQQGLADRLRQAIRQAAALPMRDLASRVLSDIRVALPKAAEALEAVVETTLPLQWCLRDVHQGNLLFTGDEVTGLVDFGAASIDSIAGDVARLAASMAGNDRQVWQECLNHYAACRTFTSAELLAVEAFDKGGTIAAAANWLRWMYLDGQVSPHSEEAQRRLAELALRLESA